MANKRMFCMNIVDSDAFLEMPLSTQCLYFHLNMRADDDGFIGNTKRIMRLIGASEDDLKILIAKRFILVFDDGVIVIKHWRMHNTIQKDRYTPTVYQDELNQLFIKQNKSYSLEKSAETKCLENVSEMETAETLETSETKCLQSGNNGNNLETTWKQNVSTDIDIDLDKDIDSDLNSDADSEKDLNTHSNSENSEKKSKTQISQNHEEKECASESVCVPDSFSPAETPESRNDTLQENPDTNALPFSDSQKYFARLVYDEWEKADLPRPKSGFIGFVMSDFRLALDEISNQHLHSDDVIQACKNYAEVVGLSRRGGTWWKAVLSFDRFVKPSVMRKFLPDYFDIGNFRENGKGGSAISRSDEYDNVAIDF